LQIKREALAKLNRQANEGELSFCTAHGISAVKLDTKAIDQQKTT
jgi:hypothetical protein